VYHNQQRLSTYNNFAYNHNLIWNFFKKISIIKWLKFAVTVLTFKNTVNFGQNLTKKHFNLTGFHTRMIAVVGKPQYNE